MKKGIILFKSKYGATKKYVHWLAEKTGYDCLETSKADRLVVKQYENIILCGGVYASGIAGLSFLRKNYKELKDKKIAVFCVGASPFDEKAFEEELESLAFFQAKNIKKPKEAYLKYSENEKEYIVIEADPGTEISQDVTETVVREALTLMTPKIDLEEKGCYKVEMTEGIDKDLVRARDEANRYVQSCITYRWNENEVVVDGDIIHEWIEIDGSEVILNEDLVKEFVANQAKKYDTYGKNRIFQTTDGREIELKSGAYGWKTDSEAEGEELVKSLKKGERVEREPVYSFTAAKAGDKDVGDTYVEIDLGKQHLYLYVNGELKLESDFVSGNASRGWSTPAGVFGLTYKTTNAVLRGENYATPVTYWMPFNGNIGMHDATWRSSFGGEIYLTNGSHGCINLPYEKAKVIYEYVYTGFPVVCYY